MVTTERSHRRVRKQLVRAIPRSRMVYPERLEKQLQYAFWRAFTPLHPFFRELFMPVRRMHKRYRQHYLLGVLASDKKLEEFLAHLVAIGYRRHRVAWRDPDEIVSLRLVENFDWQYHLRIFVDGEVRGHYELTPESYPFKHLKKHKQEARREEFLAHIGGWIVERTERAPQTHTR